MVKGQVTVRKLHADWSLFESRVQDAMIRLFQTLQSQRKRLPGAKERSYVPPVIVTKQIPIDNGVIVEITLYDAGDTALLHDTAIVAEAERAGGEVYEIWKHRLDDDVWRDGLADVPGL